MIRSVVKGIPRSPTREKLNGGWSEVASFNLKIPPGNYLRRVTIKSNFAASGNMKVHYCSSFHRGKENRGSTSLGYYSTYNAKYRLYHLSGISRIPPSLPKIQMMKSPEGRAKEKEKNKNFIRAVQGCSKVR